MKILQLGKFYPVLGGVEKVMFDLTVGLSETGLSEVGLSETGLSEVGLSEVGLSETGLSEEGLSEEGLSEEGLSEEGVECDMMCAGSDGRGTEVIRLNPHGRILCHRTLTEAAKTTIAPTIWASGGSRTRRSSTSSQCTVVRRLPAISPVTSLLEPKPKPEPCDTQPRPNTIET